MSVTPHRPDSCDRARAWASQACDGELSEAEAGRLRGHLEGCAACAAFADEIAVVAVRLRAAELDRVRIQLPARPRRSRRSLQRVTVAAAALLIGAPLLGVVFGVSRSDEFRGGPARSVGDRVRPAPTVERGVPIVVRQELPLGQRNAADDF